MGPEIRSQRLVALFLLGCSLFNYPLLYLFNTRSDLFGVPLLYAYVFFAWAVIVVLLALIAERSR